MRHPIVFPSTRAVIRETKHKFVTVRLKVPHRWTSLETVAQALISTEAKIDAVKWPIKSGGGIAKGSKFERDLAKDLSLWWTRGEDQYVFTRRGGSGGALRDRQGKSSASGDLAADKEVGKHFLNLYSIEAKFYADLSPQFWKLIHGEGAKTLTDFWLQARNAANPYKRHALLILKSNGKKPLCITNHDWWETQNTFKTRIYKDTVYVFPLSNLLALNPDVFYEFTPAIIQKRTIRRRNN